MFAMLFRLAALAGIWLAARRTKSKADYAGRLERLSIGQKTAFLWGLVKDRRTPLWLKALAVLPAVYLASPIDLLPDFIPVIGRMDDIAVFALVVNLLVRFAPDAVIRDNLEAVSTPRPASDMKKAPATG